jgi:cytochrome c-type biogenesis protein CcmE
MKPKYLVGIAAAIILVASAMFALANKGIAYMDFNEARESGSRAQVKGTWVKDSDTRYDDDLNQFHFTMKDTAGVVMPVVLEGAKPNNFEMALSVVATGKVEDGTFRASNVLTKCPSKYEATPEELKANGGAGHTDYGKSK